MPAYLNLGREMQSPLDVMFQNVSNPSGQNSVSTATACAEATCRRLADVSALQKRLYDTSRRPFEFEVGEMVMKRNHVLNDATKNFPAALAPKWFGPGIIHKRILELTYKLNLIESTGQLPLLS